MYTVLFITGIIMFGYYGFSHNWQLMVKEEMLKR